MRTRSSTTSWASEHLVDCGQRRDGGDVLDAIYVGPKAALRPIHEALVEAIDQFGPYEVAPKKGYVSLRRKKQFAMIGPATNTRVELGLNMKGVPATDRLLEQPPGRHVQLQGQIDQRR